MDADADGGLERWMPTAAMLNGTPPTEIFPTDLEKGMGRLEGERAWRAERSGTRDGRGRGREVPFSAFNDQNQFCAYLLLLQPPLRRTARSPRHHKIRHHISARPSFSTPNHIFRGVCLICFDSLIADISHHLVAVWHGKSPNLYQHGNGEGRQRLGV